MPDEPSRTLDTAPGRYSMQCDCCAHRFVCKYRPNHAWKCRFWDKSADVVIFSKHIKKENISE
jgi:hypothetical protein